MKRFILATLMIILGSSVAIAEDWHVQTTTKDGRTATVVFHIPVPAGNNSAVPAKSWRDALAEYIKPLDRDTGLYGTWQSRLQAIDAGELGSLQAGVLLEKVATVNFKSNDTNLQKRNAIDLKFTNISAEQLGELQETLKFWGYARDVP